LVKEKEVGLKNLIISIPQDRKLMLGKEDKLSALDVFMTLPDELVMGMVKYDKEGLYMMCLALAIGFLDKKSPKENLAN